MKKGRKYFKKSTAFILALVLFVTSINLSAFADESPVLYNGTGYETIEEAVLAAKERDDASPFIMLNEDVKVSTGIVVNENESITIEAQDAINIQVEPGIIPFTVNTDGKRSFRNIVLEG